MKEANIKINAHTADAEANLARLANQAEESSKKVLSVGDAAFAIAETMTGAFAIATGAIGLFAGENEKFQKVASKAQSVIAIAIGTRQLAEAKANITTLAGTAIVKANAVATRLASIAMVAFSSAIGTSSKAFKIMKMAIVSTGLGALVVGLGLVITKLMSMSDKTEEAADKQKLLTDAIDATNKVANDAVSLNEKLNQATNQREIDLINEEKAYEKAKEKLAIFVEQKEMELANNIANGKSYTANQEAYDKHLASLDAQHEQLIANKKAYEEYQKSQNESSEEEKKKEETVKALTDLQKTLIIAETSMLQSRLNNRISEFELEQQLTMNEIELMKEKLLTEELTEDESFILKEDIARKEIELLQAKADEEIRINDLIAENTKKNDAEKEEAELKLAEQEQANFDARMAFAGATGDILGNMSALMEEGSAQQKAMALTEIAVNTGIGFMNALRIAQQGGMGTGAAAPFTTPIFYASQIAAVLGAAAQAKQIISSGSEAGAGGGGITYTAPFIPESAAQGGGTPTTTDSNGTVQAFVVSNEISSRQALDSELELQSTL
tara:strand:- start:14996 stop:16666 length:1671 start_codon:yes stop_codon:yes gene_type:complete